MAEFSPGAEVLDRPEFRVTVDGEELAAPVKGDVIEIEVIERVDHHGRARIVLQNWDSEKRRVRYSDEGPLTPGSAVEISLGFGTELTPVFGGLVTALRADFPADGSPRLEVHCRSRSILLDAAARSRIVEDSSDGLLADTIAGEHGLSLDGADGIDQPLLVQHNETDWQLLLRRGAELGWVSFVRDDVLVWRPPAGSEDPVSLTYGKNVIELELTEDLGARVATATATGWRSADLEPIDSEATATDGDIDPDARADTAAALDGAGWKGRDIVGPSSLDVEPAELERLSRSRVSGEAKRHYWGCIRTIGLPVLRCDRWIAIEGVGQRLAGAHWVTEVRHRFGTKGFETQLKLGQPPSATPEPMAMNRPGLMIGLVEELDDRDGLGRVKVGFPWRTDAPEPMWCRVATLSAGEEFGTLFVPDIGEEVIVGHIGDDLRFPVVLGSLWNGQHLPPAELDTSGNDHRGIVTRTGHRLVFADGDSTSVTLTTAGGHVAVFDDEAGAITLTEKGENNSISIGDGGIVLTAGSGDIEIAASSGAVKIDASEFELKGSSSGAVKSSGNLDLKASGIADLSGATVKINS